MSYPRRRRLVHSTSELFTVLERYLRISANGHSSFPRGPCSGVLARRGLHYRPLHQQYDGSISSSSRQTLHSTNWQWEVLSWCNGSHRYVASKLLYVCARTYVESSARMPALTLIVRCKNLSQEQRARCRNLRHSF